MTIQGIPLRDIVQSAYDVQSLRIQSGNRICQAYYRSRGVEPGEKPAEELSAEDDTLLEQLREDYRRMADGVARLGPKTFKPTAMMTSWAFAKMVAHYEALLLLEKSHFADVRFEVECHPMWGRMLEGVKGCGPAMAGCLLSRLDPHKALYPSSFWAFAGFDVGPDGRGRSRRREHLIEREYVAKDGEVKQRASITFDPWLKTKLYVLATCFVKAGGHYAQVYKGYKHRLETMPPLAEGDTSRTDWAKVSKAHRHAAAMRYMIKIFLLDLWREWRTLEGLPVHEPYHVAKLGLRDHREAA